MRRARRTYEGGGQLNSLLSNPSTYATLGQMADSFTDPGDGRVKTGSYIAKGAASGASLGAVAGPWGAAIGAVVGAAGGWIVGGKLKRKEQGRIGAQRMRFQNYQQAKGAAEIFNNPELVTGDVGADYYAHGGVLTRKYKNKMASGGTLKPLSSKAMEVQGPSHEQGGVYLPAYDSEVEGKESIQSNYVFSEKLGFAKEHKRLAKAIGRIELKPATPERITSLTKLNEQVEQLKAKQEYLRNSLNLN